MDGPTPLNDAEADKVIQIGGEALHLVTTAADLFCRSTGRADPRETLTTMLMITEVMLEGLLVTQVAEEGRVPLMKRISHNVQETLRARAKLEVRGHA